jgi:catechol 2,3-dioxygenase-like lactoylglutathione lyase family enzyme
MPVFDHLVYATPDLEATSATLTDALGVAPAPGGSHPGMGTRNLLYGLGDGKYFELIGPDEAQDVPPRWFGIAALTRPRLAGWAVRTARINRVVAGAKERGYDPGGMVGMSRQGADGEPMTWRLTMPKDTLIPFLIEWGDTPHPSARDLPQLTLDSFAAEHPEPALLRHSLEALGVALTVVQAPHTRLTAMLRGPGGILPLS